MFILTLDFARIPPLVFLILEICDSWAMDPLDSFQDNLANLVNCIHIFHFQSLSQMGYNISIVLSLFYRFSPGP